MTNKKVDVSSGTNISAIQRLMKAVAGEADDDSYGESAGDAVRGGHGGHYDYESVNLSRDTRFFSILRSTRLRLHMSS